MTALAQQQTLLKLKGMEPAPANRHAKCTGLEKWSKAARMAGHKVLYVDLSVTMCVLRRKVQSLQMHCVQDDCHSCANVASAFRAQTDNQALAALVLCGLVVVADVIPLL